MFQVEYMYMYIHTYSDPQRPTLFGPCGKYSYLGNVGEFWN